MAVQDEATGGLGSDRAQNLRRIDEREADSVGQTDRNLRIIHDLMMEQDHRGATRRTSQDHLERVQPRWNDDADRIGEREVAGALELRRITPYPPTPGGGSTSAKIASQTFTI